MKSIGESIGAVFIGVVFGSVATAMIVTRLSHDMPSSSAAAGKPEPSYWVAPMDPDYKRDNPGKSPMGMDLIPVYAEGDGVAGAESGTIRISPDVVNNLGVRTAIARRMALPLKIKTVGYVKYDEDLLVHIHPRVQGWIERLYVKASGDPVTRGQALYELYSPELVNAQEEFVLALGRDNKRLIQASENRLRALQVPQTLIDQLQKTRKVQQAVTFFSPRSGVVDNLHIRQGFFVTPGQTMMSIGTLDQVWVEAEVFERQAFEVEVGFPVTMTLDFLPGKQWQGTVDYIYPTLDVRTRTLKIRLRFDNNNDELKPNMFAQVIIHRGNEQETLLVPLEAVIRTGSNDRVVLALGEGKFKSVAVKLGRMNEDSAEILEGLDEGTQIVTSAQFLLDSESSKTSDFKRMNHDADVSMTPHAAHRE
ncbi:MAG: Cu(I)/Ag(I) efflux system membrane fusion protein [Halioglobus sp.]|jgi:Cu(I)/Ag(I) efflux system membrane fusion protein